MIDVTLGVGEDRPIQNLLTFLLLLMLVLTTGWWQLIAWQSECDILVSILVSRHFGIVTQCWQQLFIVWSQFIVWSKLNFFYDFTGLLFSKITQLWGPMCLRQCFVVISQIWIITCKFCIQIVVNRAKWVPSSFRIRNERCSVYDLSF